jgi:hypothetical protein
MRFVYGAKHAASILTQHISTAARSQFRSLGELQAKPIRQRIKYRFPDRLQ